MTYQQTKVIFVNALAKRYWTEWSVDYRESHFYALPFEDDRYQFELCLIQRATKERVVVKVSISYADFQGGGWATFLMSCVQAATGHRQIEGVKS